MQIHGREIHFRFTIGAYEQLASLCPDGDILKNGQYLNGSGTFYERIDHTRRFVQILADGYDDARRFEDPNAKPQRLTEDELRALTIPQLTLLSAEAMNQFFADLKTTVEAEPPKKSRGAGIELNLQWFLFYGRLLHMSRREVLASRFADMVDMIACYAIYNGAKPKRKNKHITDFDTVMRLR